MKLFAKCIMAIFAITVTLTVPYIDADHQNGRTENVADDGTGYKVNGQPTTFIRHM